MYVRKRGGTGNKQHVGLVQMIDLKRQCIVHMHECILLQEPTESDSNRSRRSISVIISAELENPNEISFTRALKQILNEQWNQLSSNIALDGDKERRSIQLASIISSIAIARSLSTFPTNRTLAVEWSDCLLIPRTEKCLSMTEFDINKFAHVRLLNACSCYWPW